MDIEIISEDSRWDFSSPGEDSSLDERKATEDVVLVKFFVVHVSEKLVLRIHRGYTIFQRGRRAE